MNTLILFPCLSILFLFDIKYFSKLTILFFVSKVWDMYIYLKPHTGNKSNDANIMYGYV